MKILVVEPHSMLPGHFSWLSARLCAGLSRLKNEVTLVTLGGLGNGVASDVHEFRTVDANQVPPNESSKPIVEFNTDPGNKRAYWQLIRRELRTFRAVAQMACQQEFDIIHFVDGDPVSLEIALNGFFPRKSRIKRPALVTTIHETLRLAPSPVLRKELARRVHRYCLWRLVAKDLDGAIVFDRKIREGILSHFNLSSSQAERLQFLPHGMDGPAKLPEAPAARNRLGLRLDEAIFLLLGVIRRDKRVDVAIEAVKGLPRSRLVIAGYPQDFAPDDILKMIRQHEAGVFVSTELNYLGEARMTDYLAAADVLLLPYTASFKGQSGIITWSCSYGVPVIASDVGEMGKLVRESGIGLATPPDSPSDLHQRCLEFLNLSVDERQAMRLRAKALAAQYSWEAVCTQLEGHYYRFLPAVGTGQRKNECKQENVIL